jgi:hypothetical protein
LPEGGEVDGLARLEAFDVRIARPVKGDPAARGEVAEEVPANDARRLAQERVDARRRPPPFASTSSRSESTAACAARPALYQGRSIQ